jgi:hypothetical protein
MFRFSAIHALPPMVTVLKEPLWASHGVRQPAPSNAAIVADKAARPH